MKFNSGKKGSVSSLGGWVFMGSSDAGAAKDADGQIGGGDNSLAGSQGSRRVSGGNNTGKLLLGLRDKAENIAAGILRPVSNYNIPEL
jgi:hypothetical protein